MTVEILENGTRVRTVLQEENVAKNWVPEALASRKWDTFGTVVKTNDEHELCYGVRHDDGSAGWYDRHEMDVQRRLEVGEILKETDFYLSTSGSWQPIPGPTVGNQVLDNNVEFTRGEVQENEGSDSSL